jgi:alpha-1,3-glucan synthase
MSSYGYKAFIPVDSWSKPSPVITAFLPGHDHRITSSVGPGEKETVLIEIHFSDEMDCNEVLKSITLDSKTADGSVPSIDESSAACHVVDAEGTLNFTAQIPSGWKFSAKLKNVSNGVHRLTVKNATTQNGDASTKVSLSRSIHMTSSDV